MEIIHPHLRHIVHLPISSNLKIDLIIIHMTEEDLVINVVETQRSLTKLIGVSGREKYVAEFIYAAMKNFADQCWIDRFGNVLAERRGTSDHGLRIMLDAHMDEVGFIIRFIEPTGFLRFTPLGGIDKRLYPGSRVLLLAENGTQISGIIGFPPPHITKEEERDKSPDHFSLFIDIGAKNVQEVRSLGLDIGSVGVLDGTFEYITERGILRGRAFDDRSGCNVLLQVAKLLSQSPRIENTVVFSFSCAEEVGGRGVSVAVENLHPDIGIALENTIAADTPGITADMCPTKLDGGPAISVADVSAIYNENLLRQLKQHAREMNINWQYKLPTFGGTNAGIFHKMKQGIPAITVSVPCRYIHAPNAQLKIDDFIKTIKLIHTLVSSPIDISI